MAQLSNKSMQPDDRFAAAADRQDVRLANMNARARFKIGLLLLNLGVLLLGWNTWCKKTNVIYSSTSSGWDRFWDRQIAFLDGGNLSLTVVIALLVTAGVFYCVDAVVWNRVDSAVKPNKPLQQTGCAGRRSAETLG